MWADYLAEEYPGFKHIIEKDYGFISYELHSHGECFVTDFYTLPEVRHQGKGLELCQEMEQKARDEHGCESISMLVTVRAKRETHQTRLMKAYIRSGFEICDVEGKNIIMRKLLGGN